MPVDKYRNLGPEDSEDYHSYEAKQIPDYFNDLKKILGKDGKHRTDGRSSDALRQIFLRTGVVGSAKGSAYCEVGNTKILVSVFEPREIPRLSRFCPNGELEVEFRFATFAGKKRRSALKQNDEKDFSRLVKHALEPAVCRGEFPNCQVDVCVLVVDDDGSCLAAAINTAGVAIADAGIPMFDTIAAVQLGQQNDSLFLDPTLDEEEFCSAFYEKETKQMGLLTISHLATIGQFSCSTFTGCCTPDLITHHTDLLINRCSQITQLTQNLLARDVLRKCEEASKTNEE